MDIDMKDLREQAKKTYTNDDWFSSLNVSNKERIATKIKGSACNYPECTTLWNDLDIEVKQWIHDHCTTSHGQIMTDWTEGKSMSY